MKKVVTLLAFLVIVSPAQAVTSITDVPYWKQRGCIVGFPTKVSYTKIKVMLRHHQPLKEIQKTRSKRYAVCVATRKKSRAVWDYIRRSYDWRNQYTHSWWIKYNSLPSYARSWAWSTSGCESDHNQHAYNPAPFYSYFQWVLSTWYSAGGDRHPYDAIYPHQAYLAWNWHVNHPSGQWPVCGE